MTGGSYMTGFRESSDTSITIVNVDGFNATSAANYLKSYLRTKASASGLKLLDITSSHMSGYNSLVMDFQNMITDRLGSVRSEINGIYDNSTKVAEMPTFEEEEEAAPVEIPELSFSALMKYALVGFALGLVLGVLLAIFLTLRKGCIMSRRQIEDSFGLELLGDCSKNGPSAIDVLNSNLDIMVGDGAAVMLLGSSAAEDVTATVHRWNDVVGSVENAGAGSSVGGSGSGSGRFIAGRDIVDDSATIDALNGVEGIVLGVRIGESRLADVQRLMLRAHKLDKRVLGYVQL